MYLNKHGIHVWQYLPIAAMYSKMCANMPCIASHLQLPKSKMYNWLKYQWSVRPRDWKWRTLAKTVVKRHDQLSTFKKLHYFCGFHCGKSPRSANIFQLAHSKEIQIHDPSDHPSPLSYKKFVLDPAILLGWIRYLDMHQPATKKKGSLLSWADCS